MSKNYIFVIGIQLLGPFFLLIIQPFSKTSCYSSQCYSELKYFIVFCLLGYKLGRFLFANFTKVLPGINKQQRQIQETYSHKFKNLIYKIQVEEKKETFQQQNVDQTLALLHYGIFTTSFPLAPALSLCSMILEYAMERLQLIGNTKRPICKSQPIQSYLKTYMLIMHLGIFFNTWVTIFTLQEVQYVFQTGIQSLVSHTPTEQGVLALKIVIIAVLIVLFQVISSLARQFCRTVSNIDVVQKRKKFKLKKYIKRKLHHEKTKLDESTKVRSLRTIFRTYHKDLVSKYKKDPLYKQTQQSDQTSALRLRKNKKQ